MARTRGSIRNNGYPDVTRMAPRKLYLEEKPPIKEYLRRFEKALSSNPDEFDMTVYEACPDITKLWIIQDQRKPKVVDQEISWEGSFELLEHLPNELKLEIIDFIPTRSLHQMHRRRLEKLGEDILMESVNEKCLYYLDKPFVTYHKMRIINKECARRMNLKILATDSFDLSSFHDEISVDRKRSLYYFLEFIRVQSLLERKEISLDNPFIYEGVENIKKLDKKIFISEPELFPKNTDIPSTDQNEPISSETFQTITTELEDEKLEDLLSEKLSIYVTPTRRRRKPQFVEKRDTKAIEKAQFYQELVPADNIPTKITLDHLNANFLEEVSQYLGENNTIKHIVFSGMDSAFLTWILKSLKGLKTVDMVSCVVPPYFVTDQGNLHNIERISFFNCANVFIDEFENLANSLSRSCIIESFLNDEEEHCDFDGQFKYFVNDELQTESIGDDNEKLVIHSHSNDTFILNERMKTFFSYDYFRCTGANHPLNFLQFQDALPIKQKKNISEFMFKEKRIPIEFSIAMIANNEPNLIYCYIIYLANTYQNGRLQTPTVDGTISSLKYGWIPTKMMQELTLNTLTSDYLPLALNYMKNKLSVRIFAQFLRDLLLERIFGHNTNDNELFAIYTVIKKVLPTEEKHVLYEHVKCISNKNAEKYLPSVTVPILGLIFNNFQLGVALLNEMSDYELLFQNELGDTILHFPLAHDNLLINMILEKQPKLAKIVNNYNSTILHNFTADNYYRIPVIYNLIHKFDADPNHRDIFGNTPFDEGNFNFDYETGIISHRFN
ncbi:predicted protein [Naegleria gruberi]|uniref:Predicted protein n=1 Tax=Naegleria gruberi TaxID=5762 RepID=D2VV85_NAEGR|nr:uncharacterized protein NAEGRDRAFT_52520 [Naegleria gruberi]EFC39190.1 predicted protein [Naegleria gruberi]|eukprot:XP_002671934.1 predicted protein [Naegleria gruberi strain NEG-M]